MVVCFRGQAAGWQTGTWAGVWREDRSERALRIRVPVTILSTEDEQPGLRGNERDIFLRGVQVPV